MFILSCQQLATCNQVLPIDDDETKVFTMTSKRINMCNKTKNICVNSKTSNDLPFFYRWIDREEEKGKERKKNIVLPTTERGIMNLPT